MSDVMYKHMREELEKLCASNVSSQDAEAALTKLRKLESERPSKAQLLRGSMAGGTAGFVGQLVSGTAKGDTFKGFSKAMAEGKGAKGKALAVGGSALRGLRNIGAGSLGSAAFGATSPLMRGKLDRGAEKSTLKKYVAQGGDGELHRSIKKQLGG